MPARTGREYSKACANNGAKCGCAASASRTSPPSRGWPERANPHHLKAASQFLDELEQAGPDERLYDHDDQWDAGSSAFNYLASHRQVYGPILFTPVRTKVELSIPG
jgi:hypothetical protein